MSTPPCFVSNVDINQNRVTAHSALLDWEDGQRRHLARITPQAEPPFETPFAEAPTVIEK
jgi:hypothetical protein